MTHILLYDVSLLHTKPLRKMLKIIADSKIPFLTGALEKFAEIEYVSGSNINHSKVKNADVLIIRTRTKCNENLLKGSSVKLIASATIGYDHIDTQYCNANGIEWTNAPGCNSGSVKQYIASALAQIIAAKKCRFSHITLGVIGAGNVGSKVVGLATHLGIKTLVNDPPRAAVEGNDYFATIEQVIEESDIISIHVPLIYEGINKTHHMVNAQFLQKMKKGAWIINTSRGEVVETGALIQALEKQHLANAIIDVWENEPSINHQLLNLAHIATPHIAGYSVNGKALGTAMSVRAISKFFSLEIDDWQPLHLPSVTPNTLHIECKGKTKEEVFTELCQFSYNILADSSNLKSSPQNFEMQRENYHVRVEPEHLKVISSEDNAQMLNFITGLGFNM